MAIVVGTGGFERRFAYTLPAFTGTHNAVLTFRQWDFPTAAIDGGADSFLNGGGDFRACLNSDGTGELPTHVVRLVTGVAPDVEVKVYVSGAASGQTIYFFGKKTGAVAYAVTEPFGRNATYQNDLSHVNMTSGTLVDATGNTTAVTGGSPAIVSGPFGYEARRFSSASEYVSLGVRDLSLVDLHLSVLISLNSINDFGTIISTRLGGAWQWQWRLESGDPAILIGSSSPNDPAANLSISTWYKLDLVVSGSSISYYRDGVLTGTASVSGVKNQSDFEMVIANTADLAETLSLYGDMVFATVRETANSSDFIALEYSNQSNVGSSWGTVGALEDTTGGGGTTYEDFLNLQTSSSLLNSILGTFESSLQLPSLSALSFQPNIEFNTESLIGSSSSDTYSLGQLIEESLALNTSSTLSQSVVNIIDVVKTEDTLSNISSSASLDINLSQNLSSSQALTTAVQKVINETLLLSVTSTFQTSLGNIFNELVTLSSSSDVTSDVTAVYAGDVTLSSVSTTFSNANVTYDISLELSSTNSDSYLAGNTFEEVVSLESAIALTVESAFGELTQTPTRRTLYISSENRVVTIVAEKRTISI